jgi:hypothetical protein
MKASYGVNVAALTKTKDVWSQDAILRDVTAATLSASDTKKVNQHLSAAGKLFNKISGSTLRSLQAHPELPQLIEQYNNTFVRAGEQLPDARLHTQRLIKWITAKYQKEIDKRKTAKGKLAQQSKLDNILEFFSEGNKASLIAMFDLQKHIVAAKLILINKLDNLQNIDTFVKTSNGFKTTGAEGYVAIDVLGGDAVKLVDRMEFSYNNFSPDILKGWDKPTRN